jgi:hypothetical protein
MRDERARLHRLRARRAPSARPTSARSTRADRRASGPSSAAPASPERLTPSPCRPWPGSVVAGTGLRTRAPAPRWNGAARALAAARGAAQLDGGSPTAALLPARARRDHATASPPRGRSTTREMSPDAGGVRRRRSRRAGEDELGPRPAAATRGSQADAHGGGKQPTSSLGLAEDRAARVAEVDVRRRAAELAAAAGQVPSTARHGRPSGEGRRGGGRFAVEARPAIPPTRSRVWSLPVPRPRRRCARIAERSTTALRDRSDRPGAAEERRRSAGNRRDGSRTLTGGRSRGDPDARRPRTSKLGPRPREGASLSAPVNAGCMRFLEGCRAMLPRTRPAGLEEHACWQLRYAARRARPGTRRPEPVWPPRCLMAPTALAARPGGD